MTKYLIFRLYGPMASWGDIAVGEVRPSLMIPSKSAVMGLIAAALGIRREQEEQQRQLNLSYGFAVRVDRAGIPMVDYHTAQVPSSGKGRNRRVFHTRREEINGVSKHELNTVLSQRDYRMDAFYTIALWMRKDAPYALEIIADKLKEPEFVLYLGRKACPLALPVETRITEADSLKGALQKTMFDCLCEMDQLSSDKNPAVYWDKDIDSGMTSQHVFERRDEVLSRKRWQFDVRKECQGIYTQEE